jgi:nuclear RNA export factor
LAEYFKDSRNVKKLKDPSKCVMWVKQYRRKEWEGIEEPWSAALSQSCFLFLLPTALRFRLLKHTRLNVVAFLNELPKTQHDINSFVVDISAQTVSTYFSTNKKPGIRSGGEGDSIYR